MDMKKLILTEDQFNKLLEQTIVYDESEIPKIIEVVSKDVMEGKKTMSKLLSYLKTINIGNILEEPVKYTKITEDCGKLAKVYNVKFNKYYDVRESFEQKEYYSDKPYSNEFRELDRLVTDLDNLQTDLDNLYDIYTEIVEPFVEYGKVSEKISYFEKEYPPETINITPRDNNPE